LGFKNLEILVDGKKEIKSYKNTYANTVLGTLNTIYILRCSSLRKFKNCSPKTGKPFGG
jgi:hypothetical protein